MHQSIVKFIVDLQRADGSFGQIAGDVHTTAQMAALLQLVGDPQWQPALERTVDFLLEQQQASGNWTQGLRAPEAGITGWAIAVLERSNHPDAKSAQNKAYAWLLGMQKPSGEIVESENVRRITTYSQSYGVYGLSSRLAEYQADCEKSVDALIAAQNADGGFGLRPEEPSNPAATAYVMHGLSRLQHVFPQGGLFDRLKVALSESLSEMSWQSKMLLTVKSMEYLSRTQAADGGWRASPSDANGIEGTAAALHIFKLAEHNPEAVEQATRYLK